LTGSKNNAGDYLIKHRAIALLDAHRPDRDIIDFNAWEAFDSEKLEIVNNSKALILLGGPALQKNMYPQIYPLTANLDNIRVPVVMMGTGWKSYSLGWNATHEYRLSDSTHELLKKIDHSGLLSSVRDYQTLNMLNSFGYKNILMTGCPAYYDLINVDNNFKMPDSVKTVAFSLGVSFIDSPSMKMQMENIILALKDKYSASNFQVVFHHSLDKDQFMKTHGATRRHVNAHQKFAKWLSSVGVSYIDISGSAKGLIEFYSGVDIHIGYRVHAHIFMNSIGKLSVLIAEDARAKGTQTVISGMVVDGYKSFTSNQIARIANRMMEKYDRYKSNQYALKDVLQFIDYELTTKGQRSTISRLSIQNNYETMQKFLKSLP
jgi:hypothetical protein